MDHDLIINGESAEYTELSKEFQKAGIAFKRERITVRAASGQGSEILVITIVAQSATAIAAIVLAVASKLNKRIIYRRKGIEIEVQNYKAEEVATILQNTKSISFQDNPKQIEGEKPH